MGETSGRKVAGRARSSFILIIKKASTNMAKQKPPSEPADYLVTLNGSPDVVTVTAISPEEAITKVIADTESLRDRRNYTAILKSKAEAVEGARPTIKTK